MLASLRARVNALGTFRFDLALALIGCVAVVAEAALLNAEGHSRPLTALMGVAMTLPAAWRRQRLLPVAAVYGLVGVAQPFLDSFLLLTLTTPFIVCFVLLYTAGRYEAGRTTWLAAALVTLPLWASAVVDDAGDGANALFFGVVLLGSPLVAGRALRRRALMQQELRERAELLEAQREQRALDAVADERNHLAGELQAVVANSVSAMVVQADGVRLVLDAGSGAHPGSGPGPADRADEALRSIEQTGRDALTDMRRLLGVLRREDEGPALRPQPSLAQVESLVARASDGVPVGLSVEGEPAALPPGIDLAAYRVVAQALESARAAGGVSRVDVEIAYGDRELRVAVADDRAASEPDRAMLAALRERVALYDGWLAVEPGSGGRGCRLTARLPREAVPA